MHAESIRIFQRTFSHIYLIFCLILTESHYIHEIFDCSIPSGIFHFVQKLIRQAAFYDCKILPSPGYDEQVLLPFSKLPVISNFFFLFHFLLR